MAASISGLSGTLTNGSPITLSGSFGSKAAAAPVLWDTISNQAAYSALANGDTIPVGVGDPWPLQCSLGGGACVKYNTSDTQRGVSSAMYKASSTSYPYMDGITWPKTNQVYVSWWWKCDTQINDGGNHSSKFLRLSDSTDEQNKTLSWTQSEINVFNNPTNLVQFNGTSNTVNGWDFFELWFDSANTVTTGRLNGTAIFTDYSWAAAAPMQFNEVWKVGLDSGGVSPLSVTAWLEDIYVDSTFSRVMIGDASTYAACTHLEMQPPSAWGSGQVTVTLNIGSFAPNATVYFYAFDSAGSPNTSGFAATLGSSQNVTSTRAGHAGAPRRLWW